MRGTVFKRLRLGRNLHTPMSGEGNIGSEKREVIVQNTVK